jgi:hypothetical protein
MTFLEAWTIYCIALAVGYTSARIIWEEDYGWNVVGCNLSRW